MSGLLVQHLYRVLRTQCAETQGLSAKELSRRGRRIRDEARYESLTTIY
jgi:hypothetical protein